MSLRRAFLILLVVLPLLLAAAWWWATSTGSGTRFVWSQVEHALDGRIATEAVDGSLASGLEMAGFRYSDKGVTVEIARFAARVRIGFWPLAIHVTEAKAREVSVDVRKKPSPGRRPSLEERLAALVLPFELHVGGLEVLGLHVSPAAGSRAIDIEQVSLAGAWTDRVEIEQVTAVIGERRLGASGTLELHGSGPLDAELEFRSGTGLLPQIDSIDATAGIDGDLRGFAYTAQSEIGMQQLGPLALSAAGQGGFGGVRIASATVDGEALRAAVQGEIRWKGGFRADLGVELETLALARFLDAWPESHPVGGRFKLRYAAPELAIEEALISVAGTGARLTGAFALDADSGQVAADLDWQELRWPLDGTPPRLASEAGSARLSGSLDDWRAAGTIALASPGLPQGRFSLEAQGDRDRAAGRITEGELLGGSVSGSAAASWRGAREFSADLELTRVRPDALLPDWPGVVSGQVRGSGQLEPFRFDARLDAVRGSLRGWPLRADGRIALENDGLSADGLLIRHGESELELSGGMQQPGGVSFNVQVADLGHYLDGVTGDLEASGRLAERAGEPVLAAEVSSQRLGFDDAELLDTTLEIDATPGFQAVVLKSILDDQQLEFAAAGAPDDPGAPTRWDGTLTALSLRQQGEGEPREIHLVESAALRVTRNSLSLSRVCLQGSLEARLCLELDWVAKSRLEVQAEFDSIAVDRVNQFFDTGFAFDQLVTGQMRWKKPADGPLAASAELAITAGTIRNKDREDLVVRTGEGEFNFDVRDGALLNGEMHLPLPDTGKIDGAFSIADISNLDSSTIDGHVDAVLTDLSVLRVLLPTVDQADGRLEAKVDIGGTAGAPVVTGSVTLGNGVLEYRPIGLRLEDIEVEATFDEERHFDLAGEFRAGEGQGTLQSSGSYGSGIREDLVVALRGRDLRLIDVPDLQATANTDVRIGFDDGVIRLDGSVLVPHARISPRSLPATRHSESPDVVIVAGELPVEREEEERSMIVLDGKLEVGLGDDVIVDIDLAEASVTGTVTFEWDRNLVPVANGRYEIAGDVQAYGQVLTITEGTIRFPNVPANNPNLRIRAEREIFGNSQIKTAGILVDGTVKRPIVEPYTEPRTTRERALTLLVTGSDFDVEQGVGAVDFGTYIAPRLFVSYGIGLFDQENVISARYDLGKGFGLKATSGQKESGVDVIYHVER